MVIWIQIQTFFPNLKFYFLILIVQMRRMSHPSIQPTWARILIQQMHTGWKSRKGGSSDFVKIPGGGGQGFPGKIAWGGSPYFGFYCIFINKLIPLFPQSPSPLLCASLMLIQRLIIVGSASWSIISQLKI